MPVQLTVKTRGAEIVRAGLEDLSKEVPRISRRRIYNTMLKVRSRLRAPAPKPSYPIRWDSERQRRKVLALLRQRGDLPYTRKGRYEKGWHIARTPTGYRLENPVLYSRYVGGAADGSGQSNIHRGRWPLFQQIVEEEIQTLPPDIEQHIGYYARSRGF